jgi:hypothetical protein
MKRCRRCGELRPLERFEPKRATCRDCVNAANRARRRTYRSDYQRWYDYGLTGEMYLAMIEAQDGRCPICGGGSAALVVDHDHRTGRVRGLLCGPCNRALGHLQDQPGLCRAAAGYLR